MEVDNISRVAVDKVTAYLCQVSLTFVINIAPAPVQNLPSPPQKISLVFGTQMTLLFQVIKAHHLVTPRFF